MDNSTIFDNSVDDISGNRNRSESIDIEINDKNTGEEDNSKKIQELMMEFEKIECDNENNLQSDLFFSEIQNYDLNFTVRDLALIYEYYYGVKYTKGKKMELITAIALFEHNLENYEVVAKRHRLWQNIQEIKADKFMRRFVLWEK
jgi:hypothetical protein